MPAFDQKWTLEQRDAVAEAYVDRGIRPCSKVAELAKAGELRPGMGPFDMPINTIRHEVRRLRNRRAGKVRSELAERPDASQVLKRQLLAMAAEESEFEKRKKRGTRDLERIRQIARALREAQAIPEQGQRAVRPGDKTPGTHDRESGETRGGLAGSILAAARNGHNRSEDPPSHRDTDGDSSGQGAAPAAA